MLRYIRQYLSKNTMDQSRPRIGIIGGAGPMAGALLFEKIIRICQQKYRCTRDADFPYLVLMNYPFADMLTSKKNRSVIESQLEECYNFFLNNRVSVAAIACNTLHAFLPPQPKHLQIVHMIEETKNFIRQNKWENPLILCSSTSSETRLHAQFFSCRYPKPYLQKEIDVLIDKITAGHCIQEAANLLNSMCEDSPTILGCTELTLLHERAPLNIKNICNPDSIVAEKICKLIFNDFPDMKD